MRARSIAPLFLLGGVSAEPAVEERFGYGLALSIALMEGDPHFDMYEAPTLVPQIAALCEGLDGIEAVNGGVAKLRELRRAPGTEVDSRIYELLVASRSAAMGRTVAFIPPAPPAQTADLRILDLPFPAVVECKMQSRVAGIEGTALKLFRAVVAALSQARSKNMAIIGDVRISLTRSAAICTPAEVLGALLDMSASMNPFQMKTFAWGTIDWRFLPIETRLDTEMKLFCPFYMDQLLDRSGTAEDQEWDGTWLSVKDHNAPLTTSVNMPLCIRWKLESEEDQLAMARNVVSLLGQAVDQIPYGEAGILYVAFLDSHRPSIADRRTKRIIEALPKFGHERRGVIAPMAQINRLYPHVLGHGLPDLIESAIPATQDKERTLHQWLPTIVYTHGDGANRRDAG